ncbi:MAG: non-canonical purine NTP pyrophosphatase [Parcubacteria group bacterium]|nr:non-canonical purine NTP pyrophosphatase [Parcubacteria group bacterium]
MDRRLLVATSNSAKLAEYKKFLEELGVPIVGLHDVGILHKAEETGKTFEENALLKARVYVQLSGLPTIADDGGFEIDALGGEPGVKSHRWLGYEAGDEELIAEVFRRLEGVPNEKRTARIRSVLAVVTPGGEEWKYDEAVEGVIPKQPSATRVSGFPFRSVLFVPRFGKFFINLTEEEHHAVNQRLRAVKKALPVLRTLFSG